MRIIVVGGSNSRGKNGYVGTLASLLPAAEVINLSVGAAPSIMGVYRLLSFGDLQPDDVVVWEYALNDTNHITAKGYDEDLLLRFVEHGLIHARDSGARMLPLLFNPLAEERVNGYSGFRAKLHFLYSHYGVRFLDVSHHCRAAWGLRHLEQGDYKDGNHYAFDGRILNLVADWAAAAISAGIPPVAQAAPLCDGMAEGVKVISAFPRAHAEIFRNAALWARAYDPGPSGFDCTPFRRASKLTALCVLAAPGGGVLNMDVDGERHAFSLTHDEAAFWKPLLKVITIPNLLGRDIPVSKETRLGFSWSDTAEGTLVDMGFSPPGA